MSVGDKKAQGNWSGRDFLVSTRGPVNKVPPARMLYLAYRIQASGALCIKHPTGDQVVYVDRGQVIQLQGFADLVRSQGVEGQSTDDLAALLGKAISRGIDVNRALEAACTGLGTALARYIGAQGGEVWFAENEKPRGQAMQLPQSIPMIIGQGLRATRPPAQVKDALAQRGTFGVRLVLPTDSPEARWGLDPLALRLVRSTRGTPRVGTWLENMPADNWEAGVAAADMLIQLGVVRLIPASKLEATNPEGSSYEISVDEQRADKPAAQPSGVKSINKETRQQKAKKSDKKRMDPRVMELKEARMRLRQQSAIETFELAKAEDMTPQALSNAFRKLSARFHPDRYANAPIEVRKLAEDCFTMVGAAYESLQSGGVLDAARSRAEAHEQGKNYVTAADRMRAKVAMAQAEEFLRANAWDAAYPLVEQAFKADPDNWRCCFMYVVSAWHTDRIDPSDAVARLAALVEREGVVPLGAAKADVLAHAGEIALKEGKEEEAYKFFGQAVHEHPDNSTARRRLWLRDKRAKEESPAEALKKLFKR